jgi:hypothetical protein
MFWGGTNGCEEENGDQGCGQKDRCEEAGRQEEVSFFFPAKDWNAVGAYASAAFSFSGRRMHPALRRKPLLNA